MEIDDDRVAHGASVEANDANGVSRIKAASHMDVPDTPIQREETLRHTRIAGVP
jgi:hypothetical protein